jgi:cyclic-di-GMP-binding protein
MPSFDAVVEPDLVELRNATDQCSKEIGTRFDFKGSSAKVELTGTDKERVLTMYGDTDFQIAQVQDIVLSKLAKRGLDVRFMDFSAKPEKMGGDKLKQPVAVKTGIASEDAKKLQSALKQSKLKVQAAIQGDVVRVTGAKKDDLQAAMAVLRKEMTDLPLSFKNFRD